MTRDYTLMRRILATACKRDAALSVGDFVGGADAKSVEAEIERLIGDGLLDGEIDFDKDGFCFLCRIKGPSSEGREFFNLIENESVWAIVSKTLDAARVDVSYPLMKEVCEEIVKRYVTSFIPRI